MKKIFFILSFSLVSNLYAQNLLQQGRNSQEIVPQGWEKIEAQGDLNQDGKTDLVILTKPNFKENMKTRDDGFVYNFNQPILAIYFGQDDGRFKLFKQYKDLIMADDEYMNIETDIKINRKGSLIIDINPFMSAGSYTNQRSQYTYRYQNKDFYLIGKDASMLHRATGEEETVSENYLTWKKVVINDNAFENGKRKEKWHKLNKKPLEKLGKQGLY
ncbi:MAG: hypothetical protein IKI11_03365 [Neisseriaceae bacterium]|nr:hypothetical protein [Neisseriaceae bacterium]